MKTLFLTILMAACVGACSDQEGRDYDLWVGSEWVDCAGASPQQCLMVREAPVDPWQLFYSGIQGFDFEPGYNYHLRVRETKLKNPPLDGSSLRVVLLEVIEKTLATSTSSRPVQ